MLLTFWLIFIVFISPILVGFPVVYLLSKEKDSSRFWIKVFFIGLSVIVLPLQNLAYLNVPLKYSAFILWAITGILLVFLLLKRPVKIPAINRTIFSFAGFIYLFHSLGLLIVGAKYYLGRAWIDQFNYVSTAQFLIDYPYMASYERFSNMPYLYEAVFKKADRIGQSILHGFFSVSSFNDSKVLFEPTIMLTVPLIFLASYLLSLRIGFQKKDALLAGLFASVMPSITVLHLESFLSNAIGIPFLIILPVFVIDALESKRWQDFVMLSLIIATATSIYTEFLPLFALIVLVISTVTMIKKEQRRSSVVLVLASISAVFALNPFSSSGIFRILARTSMSNVLAHVYPFALSYEGLARLWFVNVDFNHYIEILVKGLAVTITALAYIGLLLLFWEKRNRLILAILIIVFIPLWLRIQPVPRPYQFYKLLISVSPFLCLGLVSLGVYVRDVILQSTDNAKNIKKMIIKVPTLVLFIVLILSAGSTLILLVGSIYPNKGSAAEILNSKEVKQAQTKLEKAKDDNILIISSHNLLNGWLAYYGRQNKVWLINPVISDIDLRHFPYSKRFLDLKRLPKDLKIIRIANVPVTKVKNVFANVDNANGIEYDSSGTFFWLGKKAKIHFFARSAVLVGLKATLTPGPGYSNNSRILKIVGPKRKSQSLKFLSTKTISVKLFLPRGYSYAVLKTAYPIKATRWVSGDKRELLIRVSKLELYTIEK